MHSKRGTVWVGTAITDNYIHRAGGYLSSLSLHSQGVQPFCVCVGFDPATLTQQYPKIHFCHLPHSAVSSVEPDYHCVQYGPFLKALSTVLLETDTVVLTDADIVMQRPLLQDELDRLLAYDSCTIGLGYNSGPDDTMLAEAHRLAKNSPTVVAKLVEAFPLLERPIYNCGVIAAKPSFWRRIQPQYESFWPHIASLLEHYAKTQLLMNWLIRAMRLDIDVLGYEIHTNAHYPLTEKHEVTDGVVYYPPLPVLFLHGMDNHSVRLDDLKCLKDPTAAHEPHRLPVLELSSAAALREFSPVDIKEGECFFKQVLEVPKLRKR